jgi:RNA polymerase sigma factor (sigma-70 family)
MNMPGSPQTSTADPRSESSFQNTLWSRILLAGRLDHADSRQALEELCRAYWYPIYAFLRRWGYDHEKTQDLTQGFFAYLLTKNLLQKADPQKGRFRSFLLTSLRNYACNEYAREHTLKRGGEALFISLDSQFAENCYAQEPATTLAPDKLFDRRWALAVLHQTMQRLEAEYDRAGMKGQFAALQPYLTGDETGSYVELAGRLGKTESTTRVQVSRFRQRFRHLIRAVIADTVSDVGQVETELQELQAALRPN